MAVRAYLACSMTGRLMSELWEEATNASLTLLRYNIIPFSPVICEGILNIDKVCPNRTDAEGKKVWENDKVLIRNCHVLIDLTPERKSEGVSHEIGLQRYGYWKPIIRVYKNTKSVPMIALFEDDVHVFSLEEAAQVINERWGTWRKRVKWRWNIYKKSRLKALKYEILFWFQ